MSQTVNLITPTLFDLNATNFKVQRAFYQELKLRNYYAKTNIFHVPGENN